MKASCSLWSADLLALKNSVEFLSGYADEFHIDVMDGVCVPDILFGLDFVAAIRGATQTPLDVHLMTNTNVGLIDRAVEAGAARLAVHASFCADVRAILRRIGERGALPVLVVPLDVAIDEHSLPWGFFQRILLMGTPIGIKGVGLDPRIPDRIRTLAGFRAAFGLNFEVFVDGGIRPTTAPILAAAGADGIVPGSLVFKAPDPLAAIRWIHSLPQGCSGDATTPAGATRQRCGRLPIAEPQIDVPIAEHPLAEQERAIDVPFARLEPEETRKACGTAATVDLEDPHATLARSACGCGMVATL
jgi:ribulose-phosphate 3-epimerase